MQSTGLHDLALAKALAQAVCVVPGIVEVATEDASGASSGLTAATYGPGERVRGVGITHPTPETLAITIHVVIAASLLYPAPAVLVSEYAIPSAQTTGQASPNAAPLRLLADQVRAVLSDIVQRMGLPPPTVIDVVMADLR